MGTSRTPKMGCNLSMNMPRPSTNLKETLAFKHGTELILLGWVSTVLIATFSLSHCLQGMCHLKAENKKPPEFSKRNAYITNISGLMVL